MYYIWEIMVDGEEHVISDGYEDAAEAWNDAHLIQLAEREDGSLSRFEVR